MCDIQIINILMDFSFHSFYKSHQFFYKKNFPLLEECVVH